MRSWFHKTEVPWLVRGHIMEEATLSLPLMLWEQVIQFCVLICYCLGLICYCTKTWPILTNNVVFHHCLRSHLWIVAFNVFKDDIFEGCVLQPSHVSGFSLHALGRKSGPQRPTAICTSIVAAREVSIASTGSPASC